MKIITILPVSRLDYIDRVLDSLRAQTVEIENLLIILEGVEMDRVSHKGFKNVSYIASPNRYIPRTTHERRENIANIHNVTRVSLGDNYDWVFSVEDDGILPPNALEKMISHVDDDVGMITGVELGRWGLPYVGAWRVDDVNTTTEISSLQSRANEGGIDEVDGCGLYCALIREEVYTNHEFNSKNKLGPDVNLGLYARQKGFKNLIDWSVHVTHLGEKDGIKFELEATSPSKMVHMKRKGNNWYGLSF